MTVFCGHCPPSPICCDRTWQARAFEFSTPRLQLCSGTSSVGTRTTELKPANFDLRTRNFDLGTRNSDLRTRNFDLRTRNIVNSSPTDIALASIAHPTLNASLRFINIAITRQDYSKSRTNKIHLEFLANAQCPIPHSQCPIPHSQCPIPHSQCPIPNAPFPVIAIRRGTAMPCPNRPLQKTKFMVNKRR
jgi:hypothetical protein